MSTISLPPSAQVNRSPHVYERSEQSDSENKKDVIRNSIESPQTDWGFSILRCTYESEEEWAAFISRFRSDLDSYFRFESDVDLRSRLRLPVVEDRNRLNGATWDQARTAFVEILKEDSKKRDRKSWHLPDPQSRIGWAIHEIPQSTFFIYADQASVSSIVGCDETKEAKMSDNNYYFTLVSADHTQPNGDGRARTEEEVSDIDDSPDSEYHMATRQNFKVFDFVALYANIVDDAWPDFIVNEDGISSV